LEFLRIALKRKGEIPKSLEKEFTKYSQTSSNRQDEGLLKDATKITVGFRKDGGRFRITWSSAENRYAIEEETAPGIWSASEGDIAQRFPVRIYSQKQIFELAKHPQALLQVVDDALRSIIVIGNLSGMNWFPNISRFAPRSVKFRPDFRKNR
jgi:hypothetical protein